MKCHADEEPLYYTMLYVNYVKRYGISETIFDLKIRMKQQQTPNAKPRIKETGSDE